MARLSGPSARGRQLALQRNRDAPVQRLAAVRVGRFRRRRGQRPATRTPHDGRRSREDANPRVRRGQPRRPRLGRWLRGAESADGRAGPADRGARRGRRPERRVPSSHDESDGRFAAPGRAERHPLGHLDGCGRPLSVPGRRQRRPRCSGPVPFERLYDRHRREPPDERGRRVSRSPLGPSPVGKPHADVHVRAVRRRDRLEWDRELPAPGTVPNAVERLLGPNLTRDFNNDNVTDDRTNSDVDGDGIPDYPAGPDCWLNTTIPSWYPPPYAGRSVSRYICPIGLPPEEGVDVVYAYIDADNSSATGLRSDVQGRTYGFDYAIAVIGRNGAVNSSGLYAFVPARANPWNFVRSIEVALDTHRMEFSVNASALALTAGYQVVYFASDWRLGYDVALPDAAVARFPIAAQAATNAVINEVSPQPNPEWVELANPTATPISLNGWNLALNKGGKVTVIFTFTTQNLGAWGSGLEYLSVVLPKNSLPNGNVQLQLRQGTTVVDQTTYSPSVGSSQTWARFKDPITGRPMDTNNDATDFYVSLSPSPARGNDRHRPTISVIKTQNRVIAAPGELITYRLYYNNTDTGMAKTVWINDTLPSGVVFASSSVPYSYIIGPMYGWAFTNVMPGAHSFTVTVRVGATTADGQVLRNTVTLDYTDQLSRPMTRTRGWANATVSRPTITVVKTVSPSNAKAGDLVTFRIYYNNTGSVAAGTVTIKDSLPNGFDYVSANPAPTWMSGRTFYWNFTNVAPGAHSLTMSARVNSTFSGTRLVNWAFLNYTTISGYPLIGSRSSVTVSIPELSDMIFVAIVPMIILGLKFRAKRREKE